MATAFFFFFNEHFNKKSSFALKSKSEIVDFQPPRETGSTICTAGLQPHTEITPCVTGCTDVCIYTNVMHLQPAQIVRKTFFAGIHIARAHASFDLRRETGNKKKSADCLLHSLLLLVSTLRVRSSQREKSHWNASGMHVAVSLAPHCVTIHTRKHKPIEIKDQNPASNTLDKTRDLKSKKNKPCAFLPARENVKSNLHRGTERECARGC